MAESWRTRQATIRFRRSGRSTLQARFLLAGSTVAEIRAELASVPKLERTFAVELVGEDGVVHAEIEKVVHVRRRLTTQ